MDQFIVGFFLQASLIPALGAQNLFVLESGLRKQRHLLVALICTLCDSVLIAIGVAGAASIFVQIPILKIGFGILGLLFLMYYGGKKILEGFGEVSETCVRKTSTINFRQTIFLALSFSLLNPHVYLDTIILIGGYSAKFPELLSRAKFGIGAASFSTIWFFGLSIFASYISLHLKSPKMLRAISLLSGLILLGLSWKLGCDVYKWFKP